MVQKMLDVCGALNRDLPSTWPNIVLLKKEHLQPGEREV